MHVMSFDDDILMERLNLKDEKPNLDASHPMHGRTQIDEWSIA